MSETKWMQLVMVRFESGETRLYRAHRFSCNVGDEVLVEKPSRYGTVVFEDTYHFSDPEPVRHIAKVNRTEWPIPTVNKLVIERDIEFDGDDWSEEDEEAEDDTV